MRFARRTTRSLGARLGARRRTAFNRVVAIAIGCCAVSALAACSTWQPDRRVVDLTTQGRFVDARERLLDTAPTEPSHRDFALTALRVAMLDLAEGQPDAAALPFADAYDILRRQGVNDDKTLAIFFQDEERLIYWKGEPFEQAMAYAYYAAQLAMSRDWFNARAAAQQSLFLLKSFEDATGESNPDARDIIAAAPDDAGSDAAFEDYLQQGYVPVQTNFVPGYMMQGLAAFAAGSSVEDDRLARDSFARAIEYQPELEPLIDAILSDRVNTVFWIDSGLGPAKYRYGPSNSLAGFAPVTRSTGADLLVSVEPTGERRAFPVAADLNDYAADHRWRNLEDLRSAKAALGEALTTGGFAVAAFSDDSAVQLAGLGIALIGLAQSSGAAADIRHVEIMPQRVSFAAVNITQPDQTVTLQLAGRPETRLVLPALDPPPPGERLTLRYVRLPAARRALPWATSGAVFYANEHFNQPVPGDNLPFIMGGSDVSPPTADTIERYRDTGPLSNITVGQLEALYRAEGVTWSLDQQAGRLRRHVLEGGDSIVNPLPGTTGYARLFGQTHPAYRPRSDELKRFLIQHGLAD